MYIIKEGEEKPPPNNYGDAQKPTSPKTIYEIVPTAKRNCEERIRPEHKGDA